MELKEFCKVNQGQEFVGIKCIDNKINVFFPIGYNISDNNKLLKKDIQLLIRILKKFQNEVTNSYGKNSFEDSFLFYEYQEVIEYFLKYGYYFEREKKYIRKDNGKINWNKTIKNIEPDIINNKLIYLDFIVEKRLLNNDSLITLINEYCVYESILKLGWLYNINLPRKPRLRFNRNVFLNCIKEKINETNNDQKKNLFFAMKRIIENTSSYSSGKNKSFGTNNFEHIWEKIIDYVYGIDNTIKKNFFPKTYWLSNNTIRQNYSLIPDTILKYNEKIFILDAKYYKYGNLPDTSSISKQIIYGEYIYQKSNYTIDPYNIFLLPFSKQDDCQNLKNIGFAVSNWKDLKNNFEKVIAIYIDVKYLMENISRLDDKKITDLINTIQDFLNETNNLYVSEENIKKIYNNNPRVEPVDFHIGL